MISTYPKPLHARISPQFLYGIAIFASYLIKLCLATLGNNYDLVSYQLVADAVWNHKIVYSATYRYNYGPLWAYMLAGLQWLQQSINAGSGLSGLHIAVVTVVAGCDVAIAEWLRRTYSYQVAIAFLLNPVVWLISGFHAQFDNIAIYFALLGWSALRTGKITWKNALWAGGWLGLSLITKHLMLFFLLWICFDRRLPRLYRFIIVGIAGSLFAGSFLPFLLWDFRCWHDIWQNVIAYRSSSDFSIVGQAIKLILGPAFKHPIFFTSLSLIGYWSARQSDYFFLYLIALVAFSTAMADQYLVIPAIACAYFGRNRWLLYYTLVVVFSLLTRSANNVSMLLPIKPVFDTWLASKPPALNTIISYGIAQTLLLGFIGLQLYRLLRPALLNFPWSKSIEGWAEHMQEPARKAHSSVHP